MVRLTGITSAILLMSLAPRIAVDVGFLYKGNDLLKPLDQEGRCNLTYARKHEAEVNIYWADNNAPPQIPVPSTKFKRMPACNAKYFIFNLFYLINNKVFYLIWDIFGTSNLPIYYSRIEF